MLASGALDEVRASSRGLDPALPAKAHGVPWLIRHLPGSSRWRRRRTRQARHPALHQAPGTWFRHQLPDWTLVTPDKAPAAIRDALGR
jgi:hypothetical protein